LITRKDKRKLEGKTNYFFEFLKNKEHYFKSMNLRLKNVKDHRHQSYKKYDTDVILFVVILKNAFSFKTIRSMTDGLNNDQVIENLERVMGAKFEELPHYDTINDFLMELPPEELGKII
jgi:hypothetical protein